MRVFTLLLMAWLLAACTGLPQGVQPVQPFDAERYLGTWYEIARLDHSFERGLEQVSANYSLREDGGIRVLNKGYSAEDGKWQEAEGKAYLMGAAEEGYLKVSFFGPFYGAYGISDRADAYNWPIVRAPRGRYLWILTRAAEPEPATRAALEARVKALGYEWSLVRQTKH